MGGTFGCIGEPLAPMPYEHFAPKLEKIIPLDTRVECFQAPVIKDSSACTASDWLQLVQQIQQLQQKQFQHFVIIHGTDTLSYASATLSHFLGQSCCTILTGSQYPLLTVDGQNTREFTDALDNFYLALEQVTRLPNGVYLAFHHQVFHAQTVLKTHTTELDAFSGLNAKYPFSSVKKTQRIHADDIVTSQTFTTISFMIQPVNVDLIVQQLKLFLINPPHFLILQAFGTGNLAVNNAFIDLFQQLYNSGCIVILSTQVNFGSTDQRYAINSWVKNSKVLLANSASHADLYAKALKFYLKYSTPEQRFDHWYDQ